MKNLQMTDGFFDVDYEYDGELWRDVPGFAYRISNFGRLHGLHSNIIMKPMRQQRSGQYFYLLNRGGKQKMFRACDLAGGLDSMVVFKHDIGEFIYNSF